MAAISSRSAWILSCSALIASSRARLRSASFFTTYSCMHACVHVCPSVCVCVCIYLRARLRSASFFTTYMYRVCAHARGRMHACMHACVHVCKYANVTQARDYRVGLSDGSNRQVEHAKGASNDLLWKQGMCHNLQVVHAKGASGHRSSLHSRRMRACALGVLQHALASPGSGKKSSRGRLAAPPASTRPQDTHVTS